MKGLFLIILTTLLFCNYNGYSQNIPEDAIMIDENTIIKDESGNKLEMFKFMELMNSGEWTMDPVKNKKGKLLYMQLRKASEEEKKMMSEMPMHGNSSDLIGEKSPDFKMEDVNGNHISLETTKGKVVAFLKIHPIKYPVVSDAKEICGLFKISGYPTNIVIDKNGNYYDHISGGFPKIGHQILNSIQDALNDREPRLNTIPSEGMILDSNSIFKLENGTIVPFEKAMEMLNSDKYIILPKKDNNEQEFYLLKEK